MGSQTVRVAISELSPGYSPRVNGESAEHIRILAETADTLPPIVVHRGTMRVVDGMHRLRAAVERGDSEILVEYFDGSEEDAFVRAVHDNVHHGLPLSRADREAAVLRLLRSHNDWSNRAIAAVTGLSAPTVGAIRRRMTDKAFQSDKRIGRDGRTRPLSGIDGRERASRIIAERPDASLRQIAREASISLSTAQDVRKRMERGENPIPTGMLREPADRVPALSELRRDPSLRFTQTGRALLQWLGVCGADPDELARAIPEHSTRSMAELARACAETWARVAEAIDRREKA
jgi:ParB-like chromosome segregation protein Spo0J